MEVDLYLISIEEPEAVKQQLQKIVLGVQIEIRMDSVYFIEAIKMMSHKTRMLQLYKEKRFRIVAILVWH